MRTAALIALTLCCGPLRAWSPQPETDAAVIVNSGSTNRAGFRIVVGRSGVSEYNVVPRRFGPQDHGGAPEPMQKRLPHALARRFYSDLEKGAPLSSLPKPHCAKSVSFGTVLTVVFGNEKTPDLSCGDMGNTVLHALIQDVNEIIAQFAGK